MNKQPRLKQRQYEYRQCTRRAQQTAVQFFSATDDLIAVSGGTDAISLLAAKDMVEAVYSLLKIDQGIDLKKESISQGTYLLFNYLQNQTLNDFIEPQLAIPYGQALAQALLDLGYHNEPCQAGNQLRINRVQLIM